MIKNDFKKIFALKFRNPQNINIINSLNLTDKN